MQRMKSCLLDGHESEIAGHTPTSPNLKFSRTDQQSDVPPAAALKLLLSQKSPAARHSLARSLVCDSQYAFTRDALAAGARRNGRHYRYVKRLLDIIIAGTLLLVLMPVFLVIALAIALDSQGPTLYYQFRVGRDGVAFRFYKFRSMVPNADQLKERLAPQNEANGPIFKMRNDPRVTRVGRILRRLSLDELPQLFNVLRGDVSLIGPRPMLIPEVAVCDSRHCLRHSVQPGLMCLREISGRSALSFREWMELDLLYVSNQSLVTDIKVLLYAIPAVLDGGGAY